MANIKLKISAEVVWIKDDGDCSKCIVYDDIIFGKKYSIGIRFNNNKDVDIHMTNICESCAEEIKEQWKSE